jgi:hypothetical protein
MRKAVKRQCEDELLRDEGEGEDFLLSPLCSMPPSPAVSPHLTCTIADATDATATAASSQGPPTPT